MPATKSKRIKVVNAGPDLFRVGADARDYVFYGSNHGLFRIIAGCHTFTMSEARRHWSLPRYTNRINFCGKSRCAICQRRVKRASRRLPHIIRMLDAIEKEAVKRGWLKPKKEDKT